MRAPQSFVSVLCSNLTRNIQVIASKPDRVGYQKKAQTAQNASSAVILREGEAQDAILIPF